MRASRPPSSDLSATQRGRPAHPQAWPQPARARPRTHTNRVTSSRPFALRLCGANVYPSAWCARHKGSSSLARPRPPRTHATVPLRSRDSDDTRGGREPGARWAAALPSPAPRAKGSRRARRRGRKGEQPSGWLDVNRLEVQIAVRRGETIGMRPAQGHDQVMAVMLFLIEHASCDGMLRLGEEAPSGTRRSPSKRSTRVTTSVPFGNGTVSGSRWTSPLMRRPGVPQFCPCTLENTFCRDWWPLSHAETGVYHGGRRRIGEISRVLVCS